MKRPLPRTPVQWHKEIKLAIADATEAEPFGPLVGTEITPADLFHLAPVVCLKFRGKKLKGREADRVRRAQKRFARDSAASMLRAVISAVPVK